jgi:Na+/H+ antiporter NhaC
MDNFLISYWLDSYFVYVLPTTVIDFIFYSYLSPLVLYLLGYTLDPIKSNMVRGSVALT